MPGLLYSRWSDGCAPGLHAAERLGNRTVQFFQHVGRVLCVSLDFAREIPTHSVRFESCATACREDTARAARPSERMPGKHRVSSFPPRRMSAGLSHSLIPTDLRRVHRVAALCHHLFMIALLRGVLLEKHPNQAIVEAGGVGYDVTIPVSTFTKLPEAGAEVRLKIHTHVREDALALYGFLTQDEKALFEKLISVSGIGPTLAVKIL